MHAAVWTCLLVIHVLCTAMLVSKAQCVEPCACEGPHFTGHASYNSFRSASSPVAFLRLTCCGRAHRAVRGRAVDRADARGEGGGSPTAGGLTGALHTVCAAVAYFWQGEGGPEG